MSIPLWAESKIPYLFQQNMETAISTVNNTLAKYPDHARTKELLKLLLRVQENLKIILTSELQFSYNDSIPLNILLSEILKVRRDRISRDQTSPLFETIDAVALPLMMVSRHLELYHAIFGLEFLVCKPS